MNTKNALISFTILLFCCISCKDKSEESSPPTDISISKTSTYELLPASTNIATLDATDPDDTKFTFSLVAGDGSEDNHLFEIKAAILKIKTVLKFADSNTRNIRVKVSDGHSSFEKAFSIEIKELASPYPKVSSGSFENNELMPLEFGAENGNISPDLLIENVPAETQTMAITMEDLDLNNVLHWVVWNIPKDKTMIKKNENWVNGGIDGKCEYGDSYTGPFPPSVHKYKITVYFLDSAVDLAAKDGLKIFSGMTAKHIAQTSIIGKYKPN